jgi:hypothetical protein
VVEQYGYGELSVTVTAHGNQITGVSVPLLRTAEPYSQQLAQQVIPMLRAEVLACIVEIGAAVATSGGYERGPHLIDPGTGLPAARAASATVTGPSLALADALATGVAVGGDEALAAVARLPGYAGYLIRPTAVRPTPAGSISFNDCLPRGRTSRA